MWIPRAAPTAARARSALKWKRLGLASAFLREARETRIWLAGPRMTEARRKGLHFRAFLVQGTRKGSRGAGLRIDRRGCGPLSVAVLVSFRGWGANHGSAYWDSAVALWLQEPSAWAVTGVAEGWGKSGWGGWKGGVGALRRVEDGGSAAKAGNLRSYRIGGLWGPELDISVPCPCPKLGSPSDGPRPVLRLSEASISPLRSSPLPS